MTLQGRQSGLLKAAVKFACLGECRETGDSHFPTGPNRVGFEVNRERAGTANVFGAAATGQADQHFPACEDMNGLAGLHVRFGDF